MNGKLRENIRGIVLGGDKRISRGQIALQQIQIGLHVVRVSTPEKRRQRLVLEVT